MKGVYTMKTTRQEYYENLLEKVVGLKKELESSERAEAVLRNLYRIKIIMEEVAKENCELQQDAQHIAEATESVKNYNLTRPDLVAGLSMFIEKMEKIIAEEKRQAKAKKLREIFNNLGKKSYDLVPIMDLLEEIDKLVNSND